MAFLFAIKTTKYIIAFIKFSGLSDELKLYQFSAKKYNRISSGYINELLFFYKEKNHGKPCKTFLSILY